MMHRPARMRSWNLVKEALGAIAASEREYDLSYPMALQLPEDLAMFRRYVEPGAKTNAIGITRVPVP